MLAGQGTTPAAVKLGHQRTSPAMSERRISCPRGVAGWGRLDLSADMGSDNSGTNAVADDAGRLESPNSEGEDNDSGRAAPVADPH